MFSNLLRQFQLAAVFQISGDTGRAKGMIADPRLDDARLRPSASADDAVSILLEEGIGAKADVTSIPGTESK